MRPSREVGTVAHRWSTPVPCGAAAKGDKNDNMAPVCGQTAKMFIGREPELAVLREAWDSICRGSGRVVSVEGEPGVGKTALVEEFLAGVGEPVIRVQAIAGDPPA